MKIWVIKHKGKTWWGNFIGILNYEMAVGSEKVSSGMFFYRRKDAKKCLEATGNEFLEVVSAEVEECKQDNRRN